MRYAIAGFLVFMAFFVCSSQLSAQLRTQDFFNSFSPNSLIPLGCLTFVPSQFSVPPNELLFFNDQFTVSDGGRVAVVQVRAWRIGCHEPDSSAIALNLKLVSGDDLVRYPEVGLRLPDDSEIQASLFLAPSSTYEATGFVNRWMRWEDDFLFPDGATFIIDSIDRPISKSQYNDGIELIISWTSTQEVTVPIFAYEPTLDPPQLPLAAFHGRYSGQWVVDGLPASGLLLQIGEVPGTARNFIFAIWFTYIDGVPTWVVGNTDFEIGSNEIDLDMSFIEGGEFFTQPGSFTPDDIVASSVGSMTIRANHCNEIEADVDFTEVGEGTANLTFNRLIRIAGYDCDQTQ